MADVTSDRRWDPLSDLQREVGRLFESLDPLPLWRVHRAYPSINLYDARDRFILTAELPGMTADEIDLSITGETLSLRGERKRPEGVPDESYRRQERPFGRWSRAVPLPDRIDASRVTAQFAHGILTVTLPRADEARPRQITVTPTPA